MLGKSRSFVFSRWESWTKVMKDLGKVAAFIATCSLRLMPSFKTLLTEKIIRIIKLSTGKAFCGQLKASRLARGE